MGERVSSFFMLVPGPWRAASEVVRALAENGFSDDEPESRIREAGSVRIEVVADGCLADGFRWGRQGPLDKEVLARVADCSHAALIEFGGLLHEHAPRVARLGRALRDAGGAAIRMEASGAASEWDAWLERLESADPFRIYQSAVVVVRAEDDVLFTCGMHHFDLPEAQVAMHDAQEATKWLDAFCVYQLVEQPALASGHTFRPHEGAERRNFDRWPDHRHGAADGRHNPFGVWRFHAPGATGVRAGKLALTLVPSLVVVLTAAERSKGRPLLRHEVEKLVDDAPAIAMEVRDAMTLERSRGYADIEPELAWEQWQIVRATN